MVEIEHSNPSDNFNPILRFWFSHDSTKDFQMLHLKNIRLILFAVIITIMAASSCLNRSVENLRIIFRNELLNHDKRSPLVSIIHVCFVGKFAVKSLAQVIMRFTE